MAAAITTVKLAIRNALYGDTSFMSLMNAPVAEPRNIFYWMPPDVPSFPMTVFWISGGSYGSISEDILSSAGSLNFNVWAKDNSYEEIAEKLVKLLHQNTTSSIGARIVLAGEPQELFDEETDAYGKNVVFSLFHRRKTA